jgi:hypothetical protein
MRAILIRVGADGTDGGGNWVAPVDPDAGRFVYVPIPENTVAFHPGCERRFDEVADPLMGFLAEHGAPVRVFDRKRAKAAPDALAASYVDALPYPPRKPDGDRKTTLAGLRAAAKCSRSKKIFGVLGTPRDIAGA